MISSAIPFFISESFEINRRMIHPVGMTSDDDKAFFYIHLYSQYQNN